MAPGAFLVLAFLVAGMNIIRKKMDARGTPLAEPAGCLAGCVGCAHAASCAQINEAAKSTGVKASAAKAEQKEGGE